MKKSIWRFIVGMVLLALVAHNLTHRPVEQTHDVFVWYFFFNILIGAVGVWLTLGYLRRSN